MTFRFLEVNKTPLAFSTWAFPTLSQCKVIFIMATTFSPVSVLLADCCFIVVWLPFLDDEVFNLQKEGALIFDPLSTWHETHPIFRASSHQCYLALVLVRYTIEPDEELWLRHRIAVFSAQLLCWERLWAMNSVIFASSFNDQLQLKVHLWIALWTWTRNVFPALTLWCKWLCALVFVCVRFRLRCVIWLLCFRDHKTQS